MFLSFVLVACMLAVMVEFSDAGLLRNSAAADARLMEKRMNDARGLHANILSGAKAFRERAREDIAHGLVTKSRASTRSLGSGLSGLPSSSGSGSSGSLLSGGSNGSPMGGLGGLGDVGGGANNLGSGLSSGDIGAGLGVHIGIDLDLGAGGSGGSSGSNGGNGSGNGGTGGNKGGEVPCPTESPVAGPYGNGNYPTNAPTPSAGLVPTSAPSSGGSSGSTCDAALYVQVSVHDNRDCSQDVSLQATLGINMCLVIADASNGARSMMYTYNSLVLEVALFADDACEQAMGSEPVGVIADLLDVCLLGVEVHVFETMPALSAPTAGELITEYISLSSCQDSCPLQTLWVSTNQAGSLGAVGSAAGVDDGALIDVEVYLGEPEVCIAVNLDGAVIVGSLLEALVDVNAYVYLSISSTN
jgi:hypothetical protein